MKRTRIADAPKFVGKSIRLSGWIQKRRDHGKLIFLDMRDRSGVVQCVAIPGEGDMYETVKQVRSEDIVTIEGLVKERPASAAREESETGSVEIEVKTLHIITSPKEDLPVDVSQEKMDVNLDTLLRYRTITLRHGNVKLLFKVYATLIESYTATMREGGFTEIKSPKIVPNVTESGANVFKIQYFDRDAYLAQSPQFYKQAGVSAFERVFEVGPVFRAEPHFTTRHVNEYVGFDAELGFIDSMEDVMRSLEHTIFFMMRAVSDRHGKELKERNIEVPKKMVIPRMKLTEALQILKKEYGKKMDSVDIDSEGEKLIGEYVKKKYDSDFVFLTHYPTRIRPFYAMPSKDPQLTESFDLLFRGLEIATGGQRIHDFDQLLASAKKHGMDIKTLEGYLEIFRYGIPPHGGWGLGSERIMQQLFGLGSVKEAVLYPRDVKHLYGP